MIKTANDLIGKTIRWTWLEGRFANSTYDNRVNADGSVWWKGLDGEEGGKELITPAAQSTIRKVADDVFYFSWFEDNGSTVSVVVNFATGEMQGTVSKSTYWIPSRGRAELLDQA
ncbi:MoaF C-terminal domain-containing protein [Lacticaseibacillus baoqingensis]|uniref:MoaF C-terminal domain-containing protein n=1 Tax=Lacticaseibacillus baoqingensis TaxID=2486013 RepID=A0ABW4E4D1_9LACO|nr:MoaF C-terminal domain-containing protein [Lacticaseibacillus baoqingensis]